MAILDNSGDIILDCVLTDEGRRRLAKADGSFEVVKFALADDEINYGLYNKQHSSGSAYFDIQILQTPILEAFTNNSSSMKSKLMTITNKSLLYLPILKLNQSSTNTKLHSDGVFYVAVDSNTEDNRHLGLNTSIGFVGDAPVDGIIFGSGENLDTGGIIKIDAGIDNNAISVVRDPSLIEEEFQIEMDSRLGFITDSTGRIKLDPSIDDDGIAVYMLDKQTNPAFIETATAAIGLPPKVAACIPGRRCLASLDVVSIAPPAIPAHRLFASVITSGTTSVC